MGSGGEPAGQLAVGEWSVARSPAVEQGISGAPRTLTVLAVIALLAAIVTRTHELVALAAPLAVAAVAGLLRSTAGSVAVGVTLDRLATVEGTPLMVRVEVSAPDTSPVHRLEVGLDADGALAGGGPARAVRLAAGRARTIELEVSCPRWGIGRVNEVVLRWRDPAGFVVRSCRCEVGAVVRVLPGTQTLQTLARTDETQLATGSAVARQLGEGVELGDVRRHVPGDRMRSINWRVSARRDGLWVTDRHLERNVDVILAVDAVLPAALPAAVRGASALAAAHLAQRDRVGVLGVGGTLRWLTPGSSEVQRHRITEALIRAQAYAVSAWGGDLAVPVQALPPRALVIALTSLLDDRSAGTLFDLRNRGFSLVVIEVDVALPADAGETVESLADRLHALVRQSRRDRLRGLGVPVARWDGVEPLEVAVAEIAAYRRAQRRVRT